MDGLGDPSSIRPWFGPLIRATARVEVTPGGVRVRNGLRVRLVPLDQVNRFDWRSPDAEQSGRRCILLLTDGQVLPVEAMYQAPAGRVVQLNNEVLRLRT